MKIILPDVDKPLDGAGPKLGCCLQELQGILQGLQGLHVFSIAVFHRIDVTRFYSTLRFDRILVITIFLTFCSLFLQFTLK